MAYRSVAKLEKRAEEGDREAAWELLDLVAVRNPAAQEVVVRKLMGSKASEDCDEVAQHRQGLWELKHLVNSNPREALSSVEKALREPHGVCYRVQLFGARAHIERALGDLDAAERTLKEAWDLGHLRPGGRHCPGSVAELLRRQSRLLAAQGRSQESLVTLEEALGLYEAMGTPGHDPDGNGIANCLYRRGQLKHLHFGDLAGAIEDFSTCLRLLKPRESPDLYDYGVRALAYGLSLTGNEKSEKLALKMISKARKRFHRVTTPSTQRSGLDWMEGSMRCRLRDKPYRGWDLLERAQYDYLVHLGMVEEFLGVTSDMYLVAPSRGWILANLEAMWPAIERLVTAPELLALLSALSDAAKRQYVGAEVERRRAIWALREAVSQAPGVQACLLAETAPMTSLAQRPIKYRAF